MDLQDVRKFVRKGDDATKLLEEMGYRYESNVGNAPPRWVKPAGPLDPVYEVVGKLMADVQAPLLAQLEKLKAELEGGLKAGDCFTLNSEWIHKYGRGNTILRCYGRNAVFKARVVEQSDSPAVHSGVIVRFGRPTARGKVYGSNSGHWLPVEAVIRVKEEDF